MIDDEPMLKVKELAEVLGISASQIYKYRSLGYEMEFGEWTTMSHFKAWLREHYRSQSAAKKADLKKALDRVA